VVSVSEISGVEGDVISLQEIFVFKQRGIDANGKVIGQYEPTGIRPKCMEKIARAGYAFKDKGPR
jgi:pilus assembly protein CpaF